MKKAKNLSAINQEFNSLRSVKKADILWDAIDYMQQYNGRSRMYCVALAMGYTTLDGTTFEK